MVNETDATHADAGGELLNAFNVATFKNEEDDAVFWNRLIPTKERAPSEEEPEQLGIRAARLKTYDDVRAPSVLAPVQSEVELAANCSPMTLQ